jgi:hypothetical protein
MTPTPGPWAFDGIRVYAPAQDEMVVRAPDVEERGGLIALVYAPIGAPREERQANSHLVAAAPTMLQALQDVWVLAEALDIGNHERAMFREAVAAAIDAAEGRGQSVTP